MTTPTGQIVTFYSYKGGVGRTMALANVAVLLAQRGQQVLLIDFDLEAPGLHRYFLTDATPLGDKRYQPRDKVPGVIEFFTELRERLQALQGEAVLDWTSEETKDAARALIGDMLDGQRFLYQVTVANPNPPGEAATVALMTAGRFDEGFPARVQGFDWQGFYGDFAEVLPLLREALKARYDQILIDSRTGLTDIGSICTVLLPDKLVLAFAPNSQSLEGALEVGKQALLQRRALTGLPSLVVLPLISRLEDGEQQLREQWVKTAQARFDALLSEHYNEKGWLGNPYFERVRVPHRIFYAYGEWIAAERESASTAGSLAEAFARFVPYLAQDDYADVTLLSLLQSIDALISEQDRQGLHPSLTNEERAAIAQSQAKLRKLRGELMLCGVVRRAQQAVHTGDSTLSLHQLEFIRQHTPSSATKERPQSAEHSHHMLEMQVSALVREAGWTREQFDHFLETGEVPPSSLLRKRWS